MTYKLKYDGSSKRSRPILTTSGTVLIAVSIPLAVGFAILAFPSWIGIAFLATALVHPSFVAIIFITSAVTALLMVALYYALKKRGTQDKVSWLLAAFLPIMITCMLLSTFMFFLF